MKTTLSIEESGRLIELGVDPKLASATIFTDEYNEEWENFQHPIFNITDILSILQEQIGYANLTIKLSYDIWRVTFTPYVGIGATPQNHVFKNRELIDALNPLLIWAIESNHVNLNTDKK